MTEEQQALLERRRAKFDDFFQQLTPVLSSFVKVLELPEPHLVLTQAETFLPSIDEWLSKQEVTPEDWAWIGTRVGYFVGQIFVQKHGGHWLVNEDSESKSFAQNVVGGFTGTARPDAVVAPFAVAADCLAKPPRRSLIASIQAVEQELFA